MAPRDGFRDRDMDDEDEKPTGSTLGRRRKFSEFECPTCSAHNPFEEFGNEDEVICNWCGLQFKAVIDDEGNLKLKEL
ncbi:MAG: hypothetical protein AUG04_07350 [Deltaproteobacteria bacterium 13_1_20CM_2_69_21]|nr:MAG: hypothetical protein AUH83_07030 [Deltaproteobacteria bacterium 13_1_40CM_4_68_19]OLE62994.1 MAG: hypothetical protein AUG04_07350 [Deltaproteobacteria bacterium 13_1_20CM_2_69_21]